MSGFFIKQSTRLSMRSVEGSQDQRPGLGVVIGALGSAMRFKDRKERWSGQSEYYKIVLWACRQKSIGTVFLMSRTDIDKMSPEFIQQLDPEKKIVQLNRWPTMFFEQGMGVLSDDELRANFKKLQDYVKDDILSRGYHFDLGLFYMSAGAYSTAATAGYIPTIKDPNKLTRVLGMTFNYNGPLFTFLNMTNVPWFMLSPDPRYFNDHMKPRDIANMPLEVLGQFNETKKWKHIDKYVPSPTFVETTIEHRYVGLEKMVVYDERLDDPGSDRHIPFAMAANQVETPGTPARLDYRYQQLLEWILPADIDDSFKIFGRWDDDKREGRPQFKGMISTADLDDTLRHAKVTFVAPTKAGWATSKPWEMIQLGMLPLMHAHYDMQRDMFRPEHQDLYCLDPEDFIKKSRYYIEHDNERIKFVRDLQDTYMHDAISGKFFVDEVNAALARHDISTRI